MLGITAELSQMLCDPSSQREFSAAPTIPLMLPSSCWTGTSSSFFARKCKTSGSPSWSPPTMPPIPRATFAPAQAGKTHSSSKAKAQDFNSAQHHWVLRRRMRDLHRHKVDPSYRPFDESGVVAAIKKAGSSSAALGIDGLTVFHLHHLGEQLLTSQLPELTSQQFGRTQS